MVNKIKVYLLDTSAILSGKPINLGDAEMITTTSVSDELTQGGRDYQKFQYLKEKGLIVTKPSKESINRIIKISKETGDFSRLSKADIEILALSLDIKSEKKEIIILTDDYSIQNVAHVTNINFESISQSGITKKFKWVSRCRGCGKKFKDNISVCPICGADTKNIISIKKDIDQNRDRK